MESEEKRSWIRPIVIGCAIMTGLCLMCTICGVALAIYFEGNIDQMLGTEPEPAPTTAVAEADPTEIATIALPTTEAANTTEETAEPTEIAIATATDSSLPTETPVPTEIPSALFDAADLPAELDTRFIPDIAQQNLAAILGEYYPEHDYYDVQLSYWPDDSLARTNPAVDYALGDILTIVEEEIETNLELVTISDNAYFWADEALNYTEAMFDPVTAEFESTIYPTLLEYYGQETRPGVDGNDRMHLIHLAETATNDELGYYDSDNGYPEGVFPWSNEVDAIFMNMANLELEEDYYYATLAHEVQHLIHWSKDSNEGSWLDEGFAQLVEHLLGYNTFDVELYTEDPNFQFNVWSDDPDLTDKNYSAAALFAVYFWEQLGDQAVRDLIEHDLNGLAAVQAVLATYRPEQSLDQFVSDWYIANYVDNDLEDPRYRYNFDFPIVLSSADIGQFPYEETETLEQMGVRYVRIAESGTYTISLAADTLAESVPPHPDGTEYVWFTPPLEGISASLYRQVDLTGVSDASFVFDAWYDLEIDYDLAYISVSEDSGDTWTALESDNTVSGWYGEGLNGRSADRSDEQNGWVNERFSLSNYTGQEILLAINLLTDKALTDYPFAVANLQIEGVDSAPDDTLWQAEGFVYITSQLPQNWSVQVVEEGSDGRVERLAPNRYNQYSYSYTTSAPSTIIIAPITPVIRDEATYWLQITR